MKLHITNPRVVRRDKFSAALVSDAQALFERRLGRPVSEAEARNFLGRLTDFMWVLIDLKARDAAAQGDQGADSETVENPKLDTT